MTTLACGSTLQTLIEPQLLSSPPPTGERGLKLKLPCASADCTRWKCWWKSCGNTSSALQCTAPMSKPKNLNKSWAPCHWFGFVTFCCLWLHHQHKRSHCTAEQSLQDYCKPFGPSACFHGNDATTPLQAQCSMLSSNVKKPNTKSKSCSRQTGPGLFLLRAPFGQYGPVAAFELYLYTAVDSRPGPGGSRTTASCQP